MKTVQKKICLLGSFAVGKTSLIRRFVEGRFDEKYLGTIGVTISRKTLERENQILKMIIWDLAGGDDFSKQTSSYLKGAAGALIVCDLTRPSSLQYLTTYAEQLKLISPQAAIIFISNKSDLITEQAIYDDELTEVSQQFKAPFLLTSAKTGGNVNTAFTTLAKRMENN